MKYIILTASLLIGLKSSGQSLTQYKSLLVYKISEYVMWPGDPAQVSVKTVGDSDVHKVLTKFAARKDHIEVSNVSGADQIGDCHMVFLPESQSAQINSFRSQIGHSSVLVVSEDKNLIGRGADIVIYTENGKLKYIVNEATISAKGMTASKKLAMLGASL